MNRSHLNPTQIVDKNGVVTVRHMKPEGTASTNTSVIPPVAVKSAPSAPSYAEGSLDHLVDLLYGKDAYADDKKLVKLLYDDDKSTVAMAAKYLTTGSESAQARVRAVLETSLQELADAYERSYDDELWRDRCTHIWSPVIKNTMSNAWHSANVTDELGEPYANENPHSLSREISDLDGKLNRFGTYGDRSGNDKYWRGLTAVALTEMYWNSNAKEANGFALWAGEHPEMARVIKTATERETLNALHVKEIMDQEDEMTPSLREGIL